MRDIFHRFQTHIIILCILSAVAAGLGHVERTGDRMQVALPIAGLACAVASGDAAGYAVRFITTLGPVHAIKKGLGNAEINIRPSGGDDGFPSGHTAAAAFGASSLVHTCLQGAPLVQGIVILSGAFVGASRIEADAHFLFQVLAGSIVGWFGERSRVFMNALRRLLRTGLLRHRSGLG